MYSRTNFVIMETSSRKPSEPQVPNMREHEQRLISQLTLKRNSVMMQLRAAQQADGGTGDLAASRRRLEDLARELDRHLAAVGDAAARRGDQGPTPSASAAHAAATVRGRRSKRPAPSPPVVLRSCVATSNPDLSHVQRHSPTSRHKLRKSLSMSGSRGFLNTVLSALRGRSSSRYRLTGAPSPLYTRRSKSHDYLDLAPLDQEQRMATDAARSAQMRRGTVAHSELRKPGHVRSLSEEPRLLLPFHVRAARRDSGGPKSPRRPDHLVLPGRSRYYPREPSPLTRRPRTPHELVVVPPTPDVAYSVPGVSEAALYEIRAFEQLIERFFKEQASSKKVRNSLV